MTLRIVPSAVAVALCIAGCAGRSGTGISSIGGGEGAVAAGMFVLKGEVKSPQTYSAGEGGSVYAVTGNISLATMRDPEPTAEEGEILFYEQGVNGQAIMAMSPDGSDLRTLTPVPAPVFQLAVEPTGTYAYYTSNNSIFRVSIRGGAPVPLLNDISTFALTPSGSVIFAQRHSTKEFIRSNASGGSVQVLSTGDDLYAIHSCPSETFAVLQKGNTMYNINLAPAAQPDDIVDFLYNPVMSYSSYERLFHFRVFNQATSKNDYLKYIVSSTGAYGSQTVVEGLDHSFEAFIVSPDGRKMIALDQGAGAHLVATDFQYTLGENLYDAGYIGATAWTYPVATRSFVGLNTPFPSGVGAMIFSENDTRLPSVVFADAVTRASMSVAPVSQQGDTNTILRIEGDNLNKLYYTRTNGYVLVPVVSSNSGLKGALVSFSNRTGKVTTVVTYTSKPTVNRTVSGYEVSGEGIESVLDGSGSKRPFNAGGKILIQ